MTGRRLPIFWGRRATRPTIADCAVFPYAALAPEGCIALEPYANIRRWVGRVKELPGCITMPEI